MVICQRVAADDGVVSKHHESRDSCYGHRYEDWGYDPENCPATKNSFSGNSLHRQFILHIEIHHLH